MIAPRRLLHLEGHRSGRSGVALALGSLPDVGLEVVPRGDTAGAALVAEAIVAGVIGGRLEAQDVVQVPRACVAVCVSGHPSTDHSDLSAP